MATLRRIAVKLSSPAAARPCIPTGSRLSIPLIPQSRSPRIPSKRYSTDAPSAPKLYAFTQMQAFTQKPSPERIIIDVREPCEYADGHIPTAINMPITSSPQALSLADDDFRHRFDVDKPAQDQEVVFYCKAGVRSILAAQSARQNGYVNVAEYRGSWLDWTKNGGTAVKPR